MDNDFNQITPKMSGYLEKKGRTKMISCYKKYWFVLEGRLLLYYKSKDDYDGISPCKGTINLGPTCHVKHCASNPENFQIESSTTTITLKAENMKEQQKWIQALMSALNQQSDFNKLNHFRHSIGELSPVYKRCVLERQITIPPIFDGCSANPNMTIIGKLQKMGAKTYGIGSAPQSSKATLERQMQISLSDESIPSSSSLRADFRLRKTGSVGIENGEHNLNFVRRSNSVESIDASLDGIYEIIPHRSLAPIRREISDQSNHNDGASFFIENDIYWNNCNAQKNRGKSAEYCYEAIDYNDNNIQPEIRNPLGKSCNEENIYAEAEHPESRNTGDSVEYADIGQFEYVGLAPYNKPIDAINSSCSSEESNEDKTKKRFGFSKKLRNTKGKLKEERKVKKSESFLQRVWHKKSKNNKNRKDLSISTTDIPSKIDLTDENAMKTLSELKNILLHQSLVGVGKLHESIQDRQIVGKAEEREDSKMIRNELYVEGEFIDPNILGNQEATSPSLPPRNQKDRLTTKHYDVPKLQPPSVPPKMRKNFGSASLDVILDQLNNTASKNPLTCSKEDSENKEGKVRELIKRFNISKEEGVELRQKNDNNWTLKAENHPVDSNDLNKLLSELAKVTTAPLMTPGVTSSLINPEVSDKEIMKMVPFQKRRRSDPDYDIPRPHRSLTNIPKKDDDALEATRFFGPILKPSDYGNRASDRPPTPPADYHSNFTSITPDSLEIEYRKHDLSHDELGKMSFESHDYLNYNKLSHHNTDFLASNHLYADPRLLFRQTNFSMHTHGTEFHHLHDPENRYIDSLET